MSSTDAQPTQGSVAENSAQYVPQGNPQGSMPAPEATNNSVRRGGGRRFAIAGIIAIIVIAIIAYFAYSSVSPSSPHGNQPSLATYAKVAALLSTGKPVSLSKVASVAGINLTKSIEKSANNHVFTENNTNVSYAGAGSFSLVYSGLNINLPFNYAVGVDVNGSNYRTSMNAHLFSTYISEILINTQSLHLACSNQNQSNALLYALLGSSSAPKSAQPPDYKCVATQPSVIQTNVSQSRLAISEANYLLNNTYINASKVSYADYNGNRCIYLSGYISSNRINLGSLIGNSTTQSSSASTPPLVSSPSGNLTFEGPYSTCISTSNWMPYNFSTNIVLHVTSPATSTSSSSNLNISFSVSGNMTSFGKAQPVQRISLAPYPIVNGTCAGGINIDSINGTNTYFSCQNVDMNASGYVKLELQPSASPLNMFVSQQNTTPNATYTYRVLGLYCEITNSSFASFLVPPPNATLFTPVNMTYQSNQTVALITKCPGTAFGTQYNGTLYAMTAENASLYSALYNASQMLNISLSIGTFSVLPTIKGAVGADQNNGHVANTVVPS